MSGNGNQDKNAKEEDQAENKIIYLELKNDETPILFRLRMKTKIGTLMKTYAAQIEFPLNHLTFYYLNKEIREQDTPTELGMENYDEIEVIKWPWPVHVQQPEGSNK